MAFQIGSGFSQMALVEAQIVKAALQNLSEQPKGHQPFVSKKKEARRKRQEEARRLAELKSAASLNEIEFALPEAEPKESNTDLAELEREMRAQLGLDLTPPVVAKPAPVVAQPKPKPKAKRAPVVAAPPPPVVHTEKPVTQIVKRQLEVLLQVLRPDGVEVPFYHCDPGMSELLAEMNAAKKARGYGLQVLATLSITTQEFVRTR